MVGAKRISGHIRAAVAVMLVTVVAAMMLGCSFMNELFKPDVIKFTQRELGLSVGEAYDITSILETNTTVYRLKTSDEAVVAVEKGSNTVIKAETEGEARITAYTSSASASILVTVSEKQEDSLSITASGELVQTLGNTSEVSFTPTAKGEPSKSESVYWYVNDRLNQMLALSTDFKFTPSEAGEYTVLAKCGSFASNAITVRVYNVVTAEVNVSGELEQSEPFDNLVFSVDVSGADENYFQFFEDDKALYEGTDSSYTYTPTAGRHTLTVKVNGQIEYSEQALFRGAMLPTVSGLKFDNLYPHAYLVYDEALDNNVKVEITHPQGGAVEYSQNDTQYAAYFDENGFDVGPFIDLCATGANLQEYKFRVKSLGDGDVITESEYTDFVSFTQLPATAKQYVTNVLPCGDLYVTSDIEYARIAEYYIYFRKKEANTKVSFDCYIGYNRSGSAKDLWDNAFPIAATSGSYSAIRVSDSGGVMHTEFTVSTVNNPSTQTDGSAKRSAQLHAILPHINMDAAKNRPSNHEFAIDKIKERTAEVTYSDELYLAAQNGVRPIPKAGSTAQVVYEQARSVLRSICTVDMTDVQKAHAIYDWIMWHVTYDTPATLIMSGSESYSAYYLEGVFGDGKTEIGGVVYNANSVCDGMSKAYSLMCNIEGIPCVRVVGRADADKDINSAGGHAWNKVYVNGAWYTVDCTWGDSHVTLNLDGVEDRYELGMHSYLFLTDAQTFSTHFEPYRYEEKTTLRYAPQTAKSPVNVFADMTVNGVAINCYIAKNEDQTNRLSEIATNFAKAYQKNKTISVPLCGEYTVGYQAIEVCAEGGFTVSDRDRGNTVATAVKAVSRSATVRTLTLENSILILIKD
ncbi:MAG: hypothetical protein K2J01_02105 [Clostridiales bacterium]|nr:hypothetical protein [Clostridiales bacterium]